MDLLSLVLTLRPTQTLPPDGERPLPLWWGRAAHSLLLSVIQEADAALAERLHDEEGGPRPFTVSTLIGPSTRKGLDRERTYTLRLTALQAQVSGRLLQAAGPGGKLAPGATVELDYAPFQVVSVEPRPPLAPATQATGEGGQAGQEPSPWAGATTYQELSAPYLLAQVPAPRRVSLQFTSPTTFKSRSGGMHVPIPLPELVFGSLLERWNTWAPIAFPPEVRRYAEECLAVSRYQLTSRAVPVKGGGQRMGGIGKVTYATLNYDRYWMSVVATLAAFALYSGVGASTAMGLGQCRVFD